MKLRRFPIFYAPDDGAMPAAGGTVAVNAADSATGTQVDVTPVPERPAAEIIQPTPAGPKQVRQTGVKVSKVDVAKELGLKEAPSVLNQQAMEKARERLGRDVNGRFLKKGEAPAQEEPKPKLGEPAKVEPKAPAKAAPVAATPEPAKAVAPAKIKIGDQEKTEDEWKAHFAELQKPKEETPAEPVKVEPTAEQVKAEREGKRTQWREAMIAKFTPNQEKFDKAIANGDGKLFAEMIVDAIEDTRQWACDHINPQLERLDGAIQPITQSTQQQALERQWNAFLETNADLKSRPDIAEVVTAVADELHAEYDDIQQLLAARPNSRLAPMYKARAKQLETEWDATVATMTREKLGLNGSAPVVAAPVKAAPVAAPVVKKQPPAPGGQLSTAARSTPTQKSEVQALMQHRRW